MKRKLNVLLVDDERIALHQLQTTLETFPDIHVDLATTSATDALTHIHDKPTDAVFLDIQMPGIDGFDLAGRIPSNIPVIFVTASDSHAIRAFEINALDYLIKPVCSQRLEKSLDRLQQRSSSSPASKGRINRQDLALLYSGNQRLFVPAGQIQRIESRSNYSRVHTQDQRQFIVKRSLNKWEKILDPSHFTRINRNLIINLDCLSEVQSGKNGSRVSLKDCDKAFLASRRKGATLKRLLSGAGLG